MSYDKKTALILGATGLIGKELVKIISESDQYEKIRLLVRKSIEINDERFEIHIVNFDELHEYSELFQVNDVFCCLGTTIKKAKTKEAFRKVDYEYPLEAAKLARVNGVEKFLLVSAMGADANSRIFYNQVKGKLEESLKRLNLPSLQIFRPSLLLGKREEFRLGEKVAEKASGFLNFIMIGPLLPYRGIQAEKVADAMVVVAQSTINGTTVYPSHKIDQMIAYSDLKRQS
ncbi:oxidoreductase [Neobacillus niacini]|uniref:oxidoreductase n=1 Tax=Neobacillus niacini TaxID=86668 RepID=UPI003002D252